MTVNDSHATKNTIVKRAILLSQHIAYYVNLLYSNITLLIIFAVLSCWNS